MTDKEDDTFVHIDGDKPRQEVLDHQVENCTSCKGKLEFGFGLAGGGLGAYGYCTACNRIVWKCCQED